MVEHLFSIHKAIGSVSHISKQSSVPPWGHRQLWTEGQLPCRIKLIKLKFVVPCFYNLALWRDASAANGEVSSNIKWQKMVPFDWDLKIWYSSISKDWDNLHHLPTWIVTPQGQKSRWQHRELRGAPPRTFMSSREWDEPHMGLRNVEECSPNLHGAPGSILSILWRGHIDLGCNRRA